MLNLQEGEEKKEEIRVVPGWQVCDKAHSLCQFRSLPVSSVRGRGDRERVGPSQGMDPTPAGLPLPVSDCSICFHIPNTQVGFLGRRGGVSKPSAPLQPISSAFCSPGRLLPTWKCLPCEESQEELGACCLEMRRLRGPSSQHPELQRGWRLCPHTQPWRRQQEMATSCPRKGLTLTQEIFTVRIMETTSPGMLWSPHDWRISRCDRTVTENLSLYAPFL